jgi:hypothetical protein
LVEFPNPLEHQCDVHEFDVEDSQSSERFRFTHSSPIYHVILALPLYSAEKKEEATTVSSLFRLVIL